MTATRTLERGPSHEADPSGRELVVEILTSEGPSVRTLISGGSLTIGRTEPSEWIVRERHLSRQHARITHAEAGLLVEDLDSKNGSFIDGTRVTRALAQRGDELLLGPVVVHVRSTDETSSAESRGILSFERWHARLRDELERGRALGHAVGIGIVRLEGASREVGRATRGLLFGARAPELAAAHSGTTLAILLRDGSPADGLDRLAQWTEPHAHSAKLFVGAAFFPRDAGSADALLGLALANARDNQRPGTIVAATTEPPARTATPVVVSQAMRAVDALISRVADSSASVLIHGETGSGKELVARALHARGARAKGPFKAINCGAIPANLVESTLFGHERGAFTGAEKATPGAFEAAHGGTLFLDEIGELPCSAQAALLRVLESKTLCRVGATRELSVDTRVVTATNRDLERMASEGTFRADLLHRLNTVIIEAPPLRTRREDIAPLAEHFLTQAAASWSCRARRLSDAAIVCLERHDWPGNIRELRNVVERAALMALSACIELDDLPPTLRSPHTHDTPHARAPSAETESAHDVALPERVRAFESQTILDALERAGGNQRKAAVLLQIPLRTLVYKLRVLDIRRGDAPDR